ncbi:hypothetical protein FRC11_009019 [Ceratobasidium sp. 423]|nr:hypothetical protein FRC11_009019 [Ceratobasidium sp. 423]
MLGFVQLVSASPVTLTKDVVVKRDNADIMGALSRLQASIAGPCDNINNLIATKTANQANIEPQIKEITTALKTATSELTAMSSSRKRQSADEVAQLAAQLVLTLLRIGFDLTANLPMLGILLGPLIIQLALLLVPLVLLIPGILDIITNLLGNDAQLIGGLPSGLSLKALGL